MAINSIAVSNVNNLKQNKFSYGLSFKADETSAKEIDENEKKDDPYKYQRYGLYAVTSLLAVAGGAALVVKYMHKKVEKLYNEKLIQTELPKIIEFKAAKTIDEAIKFTKEVLKIKDVDSGFTLDALNYANKSIVDVSNANNGKLFLPSVLRYKNIDRDILAYVDPNIYSKNFGELAINKKFFDNKFLDKYLQEKFFDSSRKPLFVKNEKSNEYFCRGTINSLTPIFDSKVTSLMDKFYADASSLTFEEKLILKETMQKAFDRTDFRLVQNYWYEHCKKLADKKGVKLSLEEFNNKKTVEERENFLKQKFKELKEKSGEHIFVNIRKGSPEGTMYHEMGHLQDFGKNLKDIDMQQMKTGNPNLFNNRWGGLEYEECRKIWDRDKDEFKKNYPDLYEFLTNEASQNTAGKVSSYAQSSIGEFVAETYAKMVEAKLQGGTVAEDIMSLYKKYNAPLLAA